MNALDMKRYAGLQPPDDALEQDVQAWKACVGQAKVQREHQHTRLLNLELAEQVGSCSCGLEVVVAVLLRYLHTTSHAPSPHSLLVLRRPTTPLPVPLSSHPQHVAPVWLGHNQQLAGLGKQLEARAEALKRGIAEVRAYHLFVRCVCHCTRRLLSLCLPSI